MDPPPCHPGRRVCRNCHRSKNGGWALLIAILLIAVSLIATLMMMIAILLWFSGLPAGFLYYIYIYIYIDTSLYIYIYIYIHIQYIYIYIYTISRRCSCRGVFPPGGWSRPPGGCSHQRGSCIIYIYICIYIYIYIYNIYIYIKRATFATICFEFKAGPWTPPPCLL